jgi:hypothetical protein
MLKKFCILHFALFILSSPFAFCPLTFDFCILPSSIRGVAPEPQLLFCLETKKVVKKKSRKKYASARSRLSWRPFHCVLFVLSFAATKRKNQRKVTAAPKILKINAIPLKEKKLVPLRGTQTAFLF